MTAPAPNPWAGAGLVNAKCYSVAYKLAGKCATNVGWIRGVGRLPAGEMHTGNEQR